MRSVWPTNAFDKQRTKSCPFFCMDPQQPQQPSSSQSVPNETDRPMNGTVSDEASVEPAAAEAPSSPLHDLVDSTTPTSNTEQPANDDKVTEKHENGSLSTTLTGTNPHSAASRRKGQVSTTSEEEQPSSTSHATKEKALPARRPSLLSRFFRKIVPCIPSPPSPQSDLAQTTPLFPSKEKPASVPEQTPQEAPSAANGTTKEAGSLPPLDMTPPPRVTDSDIILPPTPTSHLLPQAETEGMTSGAVVPPGATGTINKRHSHVPTTNGDGDESEGTSFTEEEDPEDLNNVDELEDEEDRLIMNGGAGIPIGPDGNPKPLLPPIAPNHVGRKCLVLDLDETLVHSSFKSLPQADYVVPVEIEYHWHNVYVIKRPGVDNFLKKMGELYEVVVFTASLSKYADPVLDKLDIHQVVKHRLFRESCYNHRGNYVKDLSQLGRPIADTIILDNSPASYIFHPNNAVPVSSWFNDPHDTELTDLVPFLADLGDVPDVRGVLDGAR